MYINCSRPMSQSFELSNMGSETCFTVESKDKGHIGNIYFITDKDGNGSIEWCRDNTARGYGKKIDVEELINLLEAREAEKGK